VTRFRKFCRRLAKKLGAAGDEARPDVVAQAREDVHALVAGPASNADSRLAVLFERGRGCRGARLGAEAGAHEDTAAITENPRGATAVGNQAAHSRGASTRTRRPTARRRQ